MFAFSVFDPSETGYANRGELKDHLTMIGDPLDEEEAEEWLSLVQVIQVPLFESLLSLRYLFLWHCAKYFK